MQIFSPYGFPLAGDLGGRPWLRRRIHIALPSRRRIHIALPTPPLPPLPWSRRRPAVTHRAVLQQYRTPYYTPTTPIPPGEIPPVEGASPQPIDSVAQPMTDAPVYAPAAATVPVSEGPDGTKWLLYGGIALVVLGGAYALSQRKSAAKS